MLTHCCQLLLLLHLSGPAVCKAVLPGPSAAARAAAAASNKQRAAAEAAIASAVSDVLHLLAALKSCAPLMAGL
jgi:ribosomal RNA-processing protein 12